MRKSVLGAAAIALLSTTALVSAQQMQEPRGGQPSMKEQGPASGGQGAADKGAQNAPGGKNGGSQDKGPRAQGPDGDKGSAKGGASAQSDTDKGSAKGKASAQGDVKGGDRDRADRDRKGGTERSDRQDRQDRKGMAEPKDKAGDRTKDRTAEPRDKSDRQRDRADRQRDKDNARDDRGKQRDQVEGKGDRRDGRDGARADLSRDQRTRVHERLRSHREARVNNVNFSINIGTRVPRDFRVHALPADIVAIVPAYRGYRYFIVEERVVIVHPERYEIVEVIEVDGGQRRGGSVTASLELSPVQTTYILEHISEDRARADVNVDLALGAEVPDSVDLYEFPSDVITEVPSLRPYRYVVVDRRVIIVDPSGRGVIHVLDR